MPLRPDLSFIGLDDSVYKTKVSETITTASKASKDNLEKPKTVRPSAPIIEDWDTDISDPNPPIDDYEARPLKEFLIKFTVKNGQRPLTLNYKTFCEATGLDYSSGQYVNHHSTEVIKALDGNYSSTKQLNSIQQLLVLSLLTRTKIDIGEIIFSDLVTRLMAKSTQNEKVPTEDSNKTQPVSSGQTAHPQDIERNTQPVVKGFHSPLNEDTRKSKPLPSVDKTQSPLDFEWSDPEHNKGKTSSEVEPDTETLIPTIVADIQALLRDSEDELDSLEPTHDDEGLFVGYSINSKAFRVFNTRTRKVEENLHITFLENKPNVAGSGPDWLFDIDLLTNSMNYEPVTAGNQTNKNAGIKDNTQQYILLPLLYDSPKSSEDAVADDAGKKTNEEPANEGERNGQEKEGGASNKEDDQNVQDFRAALDNLLVQQKEGYANSTNRDSTVSPSVSAAGQSFTNADDLPTDPLMPDLEDTANLLNTGIFSGAYDDEDVGAEADLNNLETTMNVSPIPTTKIHKDHPKDQIIGDINSAT
ncbi:hypothetical protein Tco_1328037 [Tanacetum coccineum]